MHKDPFVFSQLVQFLNRSKFNRLVAKYDGDKYVKSYTCWNQLLTMMFGQLSNRKSLRDLIVALEAHAGKVYHLGIGKSVTRSNLSKANEQRDYRIFEEFAFFMIAEARKRRIQKIFELVGHVYAFDSTTIDLCLSMFEWAKTNVRFKPETWKRRLPENVESDAIGYFTVYKSAKDYPEKLRKVVCIDPEDGTRYIFLTNNLTASAETIAELYRNRWSVELFFKWIKQHLRIKKFWGTSENAVRIQIYCAIITYCLVAIVQHDMKLERSIYEVLQILGISLTDKTSLRDLFDKSNFKNVNVLCDSSEPNLFNF